MKARITYHGLYGTQVLMGLAFQIKFARLFGASTLTDIYFASMVIVAFLSSLVLFSTEMFLQHYNEARQRDHDDAVELYQAVYSVCLLVSGCIAIVSSTALPFVVDTLYPRLSIEARPALLLFTTLLVFNIVALSLVALNSALLSAEFHFAITYWVGLLNPAVGIAALLLYGDRHGLLPLAIAPFLSAGAGLAIQHVYIRQRLGISPRFRLHHHGLKRLLAGSFTMRSAHLLYTLKEPIVASLLANLPSGSISMYYYAQRIMVVLHAVATGPIMQVYSATISRLVTKGSFEAVRVKLRRTLVALVGTFTASVVFWIFVLPSVLALLFGGRFSDDQLGTIYQVFVALIAFYAVHVFEMPFAAFVVAMKRSSHVLAANSSFVIVFSVLLGTSFAFGDLQLMFAIPAALALAQLVNCVIYVTSANSLLRIAK